ncbi:MAG TPA: hypothetical protein VFV53_07405 [Candidatus Limnocylindrales bacterium]|nr:hypothetical protein [Candidatus Limnocylindrales bacterium]
MNQRSDIDRLLRHWMDDGPSTMPDRIVDVVADRISVQRQRRSWRLLRRLPMSPFFKLGAAAAAVLVVAVVAWQLLPGRGGIGANPTPVPTATPTASPTVAPSEAACADVIDIANDQDLALSTCRYRFHPIDDPTSIVVTGQPGWSANGMFAILRQGRRTDAPNGAAVVFQKADRGLYSDPCHWDLDGTGTWDQDGDIAVGPEVSDLVDALRANTSYTSTEPTAVTFGAYQGQELEIQIPAGVDLETCDSDPADPGHYYRFWPEGLYAQGPGNRWRLSIVDVAGTRVVATIVYYDGTSAADLAAAQAIIDSIEFTP